MRTDLRKIQVAGNDSTYNAYFHKWLEVSKVIEPSPMLGGHNGGLITYGMAIVELENGTVTQVFPDQIKFLDAEEKTPTWAEIELERQEPAISKDQYRLDWEKILCPKCKKQPNKNGVMHCDTTFSEFFAYCTRCKIETEAFNTKEKALNAWEAGNVTIVERGKKR